MNTKETIIHRLQQYIFIGFVYLLTGAIPVWAATFSVNSNADVVDTNPGDGVCETAPGNSVCTLRGAIQETNALAGADVINVPAGTFTLTITGAGENASATGDLDITDDVNITGAGAGSTIIDGNGSGRVFEVFTGETVDISDVTITGGIVSIDGSLTAGGGGIFNSGTLTLTNVTVSDNSVTGTSRNRGGGGIFNSGTLTLTDSTVSDNTTQNGGGIFNSGTLTLTNVTVSGNTTPSGGDGGAITNIGTMTLTNSTVSGNSATDSGGIDNAGPATLTNVTVAANVGDDAAGISGTLTLKNTIVANNINTEGNSENCNTPLTSDGHNLDSDGTCMLTGIGDLSNTDPLLGPLADNGGPTQTHALLAVSPAIDAGSADCPPPNTDQRGVARPVDGDGDSTATCDIGAFELSIALPPAVVDASADAGINPADLPADVINSLTTAADSGLLDVVAPNVEANQNIDLQPDGAVVLGSEAEVNGNIQGGPSNTVMVGTGAVVKGNMDSVGSLVYVSDSIQEGNLIGVGTITFLEGATVLVKGEVQADNLVIEPGAQVTIDGNVDFNQLEIGVNADLTVNGNVICPQGATASIAGTINIDGNAQQCPTL